MSCALLEQQHVALALRGQMIGDGAADGAAADDDDAGVTVDGRGHAFTRALVGIVERLEGDALPATVSPATTSS